ncbi:MAG: S41 family peptidase [Burkholderiaceae bacterium]
MNPTTTSRAAAALLLTISLAGCGGGSGGGSRDADTAPAGTTDAAYLYDYMKDWYLWYRQMPTVDPAAYASDQALLDAVRVSQDWYSYIDSAQVYHAFYDEGEAVGYGFGYSVSGNAMWIRYVQPASSAGIGDLRRGDQIMAIGGQPIAALQAGAGIDAALGPVQEGLSTTLTVQRGASTFELPLTKTRYAVRSVLDHRVIDAPSGRVGYLNFMSFTAPAQSEWQAALKDLLDQGVSDLVVDLRENGGGRLAVAGALASSLAPADSAGQIAIQLQFNDRHRGSDQDFRFAYDASAGKIRRLVWITSPRTCSASESLVVALRPLRSAWSVGEASCGKPVGFTPPEHNGKVYNVVSFRLSNGAGLSDYFSGLSPDCAAAEDWSKPIGDPTEPKLAAALRWLDDGGCPAPTTGALDAQSRARAVTAAPGGGYGIERLTGLR